MTALYWIKNQGESKQFVRHQVNQILQLSVKSDRKHCPGEQNLADIGFRGVSGVELRVVVVWATVVSGAGGSLASRDADWAHQRKS